MSTHHYVPLLGKRIRVTTLDNCGNPPDAEEEEAAIATDGFVSVSLTAETEDGVEIMRRRADGSICVNKKYSPSFKNFGLEIEFCGVNPSILGYVSNAEPYLDYEGDVAGFTVGSGTIDKQFAFELWVGLDGGACEGTEEASGYVLLPYIQAGVLGDIEVAGEDAVTFTMTGAYTMDNNSWGVGPYDVVLDGSETPAEPAALPTPLDPLDHLLMIDTALAPPPASEQPVPMPA